MRKITLPFVLSLLIILISLLNVATIVHAQTTSISALTYPNSVMMTVGTVPVGFTVSYYAPGSDYLLMAVWDKEARNYAHGSVVQSPIFPISCMSLADTNYSWAAVCIISVSGSGSEHVDFQVNLNTAGYLSLEAYTALICCQGSSYSSYSAVSGSVVLTPFSIDVINSVVLALTVPRNVSVSVDGVPQGTATSLSLTLNPGGHLIAVPFLVNLASGSRLRFDHWSDGSIDATRSIDLENGTNLQAVYVTQYRLTLVSSERTPNGAGWYDSGSSASFSIPSTYPMSGLLGDLGAKWVFNG